jgi:hypothetical protein
VIVLIFCFTVGATIFRQFRRQETPVSVTKTTTNSANTEAEKTPEFKGLSDKSKEFAKLAPPLKLETKPVLKGKIAIVEQSDMSKDYSITMRGFNSYDNKPNEYDLNRYGVKSEQLAKSPNEVDTIVQNSCSKGKQIGQYSSNFGVIPAYSIVCKVSIIDYRELKIIARKTFVNSEILDNITVYKTTTEEVALIPYEDIKKFIGGLTKN